MGNVVAHQDIINTAVQRYTEEEGKGVTPYTVGQALVEALHTHQCDLTIEEQFVLMKAICKVVAHQNPRKAIWVATQKKD